MGHKHFLVCVAHLTGWPVVVPTRYATSEAVRNLTSTEIIYSFGIPKIVENDNAQFFTVGLMKAFKA